MSQAADLQAPIKGTHVFIQVRTKRYILGQASCVLGAKIIVFGYSLSVRKNTYGMYELVFVKPHTATHYYIHENMSA